MTSISSKADAVKAAVSSTTTCTPATTVTLRELLIPESSSTPVAPTSAARKTTSRAPAKSTTTRPNAQPAKSTTAQAKDAGLTSKEREILATHIVNAAFKSLTEAAKAQAQPLPSKKSETPAATPRRSPGGTPLRRSLSTPLSPMQPRTLNRTSTTIDTSTTSKSGRYPASSSSACLSTVECVRVAFMCLRSLKGPDPAGKSLELEMGMSAFVGKLLALNLHEQALKELRVLKLRLEDRAASSASKKSTKSASNDATTTARTLSELLDFKEDSISPITRPLVISAQLYALRIMAHSRKPGQIEGAIPFLRESNKSSLLQLLLQSVRDNPKDAAKTSRQIESFASILLSLTPGCSGKDDAEAMEQRLHPSPAAAFELQSVALRARLEYWKITGRPGDIDRDILLPFSRCLAAFGRRLKPVSPSAHDLCEESFLRIQRMMDEQGLVPSQTSKSPVGAIYQCLGSSALSLKRSEVAKTWVERIHGMLSPEVDSTARQISVTAQLLAVCLKCKLDERRVVPLLTEVIEGIQGMFRGETSELDDLLVDLSLARRSAVGVLMNASGSNSSPANLSSQLTDLLETFITQYPRFTIRWLGKPPNRDGNPKDFVRFESRRQAVQGTLNQLLDGALVVSKSQLTSSKVEWSKVDAVLQDCLELLERMGDIKGPANGTNGNTYYVKISNLYYMKYALWRQDSTNHDASSPLRALRRSIDAIRDRTPREREVGQYVTKLERFADACAKSKRTDHAREALQSICTTMVEEGVLSKVAALLYDQPPAVAWSSSDGSEALSRTLCSIAKLDKSWTSWTCFLSEIERAAVLEHLVQTITSADPGKSREPLKLSDPLVDSLLRIYTLEKFPVRRLRTLLHLYSMNMTQPDQAPPIRSQIETAIQTVSSKDIGEDGALGRYIPHLTAYFTSLDAMLDWTQNSPELRSAISIWHNFTKSSTTRDDIFGHIDNPAILSTHVKAIADLASMKGESTLLVSALELLADLSKKMKEPVLDEVLANCNLLASHYANLGYTDKAEAVLAATKETIAQADGLSGEAVAEFHLSVAEHCIATGNFDKAELCLADAKAAFVDNPVKHRPSKSRASSMTALAGLLYSVIALEKGEAQPALQYAKDSVRAIMGDWTALERSGSATASAESDASEISIGGGLDNGESYASALRVIRGSNFWAITYPFIRSVLRLSALYAHMGMFQETLHYAERALGVARSSGSPLYIAQCSAWAGSVWIKGGKPEKGVDLVTAAREFVTENPKSPHSVQLACQLSELYRLMGDTESEEELLRLAESSLQQADGPADAADDSGVSGIGDEMEKLTIAEKPRTTRATRTRATAAKKPAATKTTRSKVVTVPKPSPPPEDPRVSLMRASVLLHRAFGHIHQKDWTAAMGILEQMTVRPTGSGDAYREQMIRAICLVGQSLNDMIRDPVFSALQDSTISFPAVSQSKSLDNGAGGASPAKSPATRKPSKARGGSRFADALREAQNHLLEANSAAVVRGDGGLVHRISSLLQSTVIFLSATSTKCGVLNHPGYASCSIELAKNVTWRRERKALQLRSSPARIEWPAALPPADPRRSSLGAASDMSNFQRDYVDIIPSGWTVISISPSDNREDLCITKLQSGHTPFVLRLPLERANSRDADNEVFSFKNGLDELRELIALANKSSHTARDMAAKGAKAAWWREREDLDARLGELLRSVEEVWLGGFRGVFSQQPRRTNLLARFQASFHKILDKHLPSRRPTRGRRGAKTTAAAAAPKITFDPRILELFIGLGSPAGEAEGADNYEALTDLLYFTIDILQFRGEQNAYDEIDFDAMVVETLDALAAYHQAARAEAEAEAESGADGGGAHTILVLDKSLHAFPWESLPCMQGLAVSRVPSLACLRRLITEQQSPSSSSSTEADLTTEAPSKPGGFVSPSSGTYILNPGSDLTNTLSLFEKPLSDLGPSWTPIVSRAPTEAEFETALTDSDVLLYFGHGSGAQYLRGKTLRRMERCRAVALLMGCSSASLETNGEFECHGTVWNYMLAGSPAVVGALWDVTDREVDRFAGAVFEEWGLVERGVFGGEVGEADKAKAKVKGRAKEKGKAKAKEVVGAEGAERGTASLVEAVAKGREACRFKYLTAAAMCVYGIPVYVNRE
ncbi:related to cell division-associated protein [Cephalotrichum gorgonifer]|uniref:separase n=1 Tax=Cephalotrichum gorgonifer TaxID=2041049 RepID=A0AAE8SW98_9PEZI|nr:related to cell division-associated protein [Cephalotrichum gorgonifer]